MKKRRNWMTIAWTLFGMLVVSGVLMSLGHSETNSFPSASSFEPSGTRAFYELLSSQGYDVRAETNSLATPDPDALYVAFLVEYPTSILENSRMLDEAELPNDEQETPASIRERGRMGALKEVIDAKANLLIIWLPRDFHGASVTAESKSTLVKSAYGTGLEINSSQYGISNGWHNPNQDVLPLWNGPGSLSYVAVGKIHGSYVAESYEGVPFTNRFIDRYDNANYVSQIVKAIAPKSKKVVFYEKTIGNVATPTVFAIIGPWAASMWTQIIFVFLMVAIFGAIRFGLPDERKVSQSGTRELVDALGETYARTKSTHVGLQAIYNQYDRLVRTRLKLPLEAGPAERNKYIPSNLASAFSMVQALCDERSPERHSLLAAKRLQMEAEAFLGTSTKQMAKKRKSDR